MGCIIALIALLSPRLAFALLWIFTDRVDIAFDSVFPPLLGIVFLPWTVLMYTVSYAPVRGVSGLGWLFVTLGLLADLASYGSGARSQQQRSASAA